MNGSSVQILLEGLNTIVSTQGAVECASSSNISFSSMSGGRLDAQGGTGPGIGPRSGQICHRLSFANMTVSAKSPSEVGIGSGSGNSVLTQVMELTFDETQVTASSSSGGYGSAVGSGSAYNSGTSSVTDLMILNSTVNASSSSYGSAVGSAHTYNSGTSSVAHLTILNSTVNASSSSYGSAVGSGYAWYETSSVAHLTILNSIVNASSSSYGSAVGSGYASSGTSSVENLAILGSVVNAWASNASGIGTGTGESSGISSVGTLALTNVTVDAQSLMNGTGIGVGSPGGWLNMLQLSGTSILNSRTIRSLSTTLWMPRRLSSLMPRWFLRQTENVCLDQVRQKQV
jgi:hypothetical protein